MHEVVDGWPAGIHSYRLFVLRFEYFLLPCQGVRQFEHLEFVTATGVARLTQWI